MSKETDIPAALIEAPGGYAGRLAELKTRIRTTQQRAALAANSPRRAQSLLRRMKWGSQ